MISVPLKVWVELGADVIEFEGVADGAVEDVGSEVGGGNSGADGGSLGICHPTPPGPMIRGIVLL